MAKNFKTIKKERKAPRRWLWDGMIKEGSVNILVGQQSRGKSMLAAGLIREMLKSRRGHEYLERGVRPCKILYVSTEMPEDTIVERLQALGMNGRTRGINNRLFVYYEPRPKLDDIRREILECNPDFVIIDILGGLIVGEELEMNSYDAMNTVIPQLKSLKKTILLIHHMNKQNRSMGSVATLSAMDTRMEMLESDRDYDENGNVAIYQNVHVYGKDVQEQYLNVVFKYPTFELSAAEEAEELDKPLSALMQNVIMASVNKGEEDPVGFEGTYQEVAAQCHLLDKYQFNPKKLGLLLRMNEDTLRYNNIFYETRRMNNGYHLKIWYDANGADAEDLGGDDDGQECTDPAGALGAAL